MKMLKAGNVHCARLFLAIQISLATTIVGLASAQAARSGAWTLHAPEGEWHTAGRDYSLQRFSPLKQITTSNVADLRPIWSFSAGTLRGHEASPLVVGHVMYVNTSFPNIVYALDLSKPGAPQIWKHVPNQSPDALKVASNDVGSKGIAYHPSGKIFIQLLQGELLALDAKTGKELWKSKHPDKSGAGVEANGYKQGATMTNAPIVIKDIVIAGIAGSEFGVRGRVSAFNVNDGKHLWTGYSTGPDSEVLITGDANANYPSHKGKDLGVSTWEGDEWKRGGGTTWGWYSYDPELNLFYYSTGNPGSWNPDQRPGDNKWSMTIFARNPENGQVKWAYQMTPHDEWDYDGVNENVLFESGGQKLLAHFDRNGFGYTVDRTNGKLVVAEPYGPVNWAKRVDLTTGVPEKDPRYGTTSKKNAGGICPAAIGFKDQQPAAYSPITGYFYVPANHICMDNEGIELKYTTGKILDKPVVRTTPGPSDDHYGRFIAWDPVKGGVAWEAKENFSPYAGALTTAGGIVFYGTMEGWLKALDQKTGRTLWQFKTPSGIIGNPMTYNGPDGQQYVAVFSTMGGWAGIGVAAGIGAEDPTAGLAALGAFGDVGTLSKQGSVLTVFALRNGWSTGIPPAEVARIEKLQRYGHRALQVVARQRSSIEGRARAVTKSNFPGPDSDEGGVKIQPLESVLRETRTAMLAELKADPELRGLVSHVESDFPNVAKLSVAWIVDGQAYTTPEEAGGALLEVDRIYEEVTQALERPLMDLNLQVDHWPAYVVLSYVDGGTAMTSVANNAMRRLARGKYVFRVERPKYQAASGEINTVRHPGTRLVCRLVPVGDFTQKSQCSLAD